MTPVLYPPQSVIPECFYRESRNVGVVMELIPLKESSQSIAPAASPGCPIRSGMTKDGQSTTEPGRPCPRQAGMTTILYPSQDVIPECFYRESRDVGVVMELILLVESSHSIALPLLLDARSGRA